MLLYVSSFNNYPAGSWFGKAVIIFKFKFPDTGQTRSYTDVFGEDSDYLINAPSYTDNGDGTVTDNSTDLMWQQEDDDNTYNWYEATGTVDNDYNVDGAIDVCVSLTTGWLY